MKTYTGIEYLKIDVANHFGEDKELFQERIDWTDYNDEGLEELADEADDYYRYNAAVKALRQAQNGIPTGYLVGMDACASGPQLYSVLIGDKVGAANTGVTGDSRQDLYGTLTHEMNNLLESIEDHSRKEIKSALMPFFYGSQLTPKNVFGEDTDELIAFYDAAEIVCPGAFKLLPILINYWNPEALQYDWDLPDGFHVKYMVTESQTDKIYIDTLESEASCTYQRDVNTCLDKAPKLPANLIQSVDGFIVREMTARCDYNKRSLSQSRNMLLTIKEGTEAQVLHYNEKMWLKHKFCSLAGAEHKDYKDYSYEYAQALIKLIDWVMSKPSFCIVTIHDEFKCLPNYMNHVRQEYINILAELADSNVLNATVSDITGKKIRIRKMSKNLSKDIYNAEYPLS